MTDENITQKLISIVRCEIDLSSDIDEEELKQFISGIVHRETLDARYSLKEKERLIKDIYDSIRKLDILQELIEDEDVSEIMVNGPETIFVERKGEIYKWNKKFSSKEKEISQGGTI